MNISRHYIIDSSIALYGALPIEMFPDQEQNKVRAATAFLSRATFHGAELHVPVSFFSEIMNLVYQEFIQTQQLSLEEGQLLLDMIFSTTWEFHFPVFRTVFDIQHRLASRPTVTDAEFLSLAMDLGYPILTTDPELLLEVQKNIPEIATQLITEHIWASSGALEEFPPTDEG